MEAGSNDQQQQQQHHQPQGHHQQQQQQHQNYPHHGGGGGGGGGRHPRGSAPGGNRRTGGGGGGNDGSNQHFQHLANNPHLKQPGPPGGYTSGVLSANQSSMDHHSSPGMNDSFHQEGGFNVSRGGGGSGGGGGGTMPPSNYPGMDAFVSSHHNGPPHNVHGNLYGRQDGGHHHHSQHHPHHHHHRSQINTASGGSHHHQQQQHHHNTFPSAGAYALMGGPTNLAPQGTVMMVYGLNPDRLNCDRLFNLFCLYGNVVRVKFLRTKEGCAMVQMGDVLAVDRCVSSLNKVILFGNELQISYSKQAFLHDVIQPFILPDGSPSFKDFMGNKNNRFKNPEVASKNRILPPSPVLHFFNAPFGITEDELALLFKQTTDHEPVSIKIFTPKAENTKSFSGLVTFRDPTEATEALILCNHLSMPKAGASHPYILRLCFSPPNYSRNTQQQQQQQQAPPATAQPQTFVAGQVG